MQFAMVQNEMVEVATQRNGETFCQPHQRKRSGTVSKTDVKERMGQGARDKWEQSKANGVPMCIAQKPLTVCSGLRAELFAVENHN